MSYRQQKVYVWMSVCVRLCNKFQAWHVTCDPGRRLYHLRDTEAWTHSAFSQPSRGRDITMVFTNRVEHCIMFPSCCHLLIPNPLETMSLKLINSLNESSRPLEPVTECHACVTRRCHERRLRWPSSLQGLLNFPFKFSTMFVRTRLLVCFVLCIQRI